MRRALKGLTWQGDVKEEEETGHVDTDDIDNEEPDKEQITQWNEDDGIYRCGVCNWEIVERECGGPDCGVSYAEFVQTFPYLPSSPSADLFCAALGRRRNTGRRRNGRKR